MPYMTEKEIQEMHISMIGYETKNDSLEADNRALREALRRYVVYTSFDGERELGKEFGHPEFPDSSLHMEAWLEREKEKHKESFLLAGPNC